MNPVTQTYPILYAAYGANTNRGHMATRCPTAQYVGNCTLHDFALVFRGVADVVDAPRSEVVCALWEIQPNDERALDRFEGFPNFYGKRYARIQFRGQNRLVMFYVMAGVRRDVYEPPQSYEDALREGYAECGMPIRQINRAVKEAARSSEREKRYRGAWVKRDIAAKAATQPRQQDWITGNVDTDYPSWMRANFNLRNLDGV